MAVEHRVYGPPGTGKTTYLARQCQRAADKWGGGGVVVASLTKTAAAEVAGRDTHIPAQNIGTLHSHAYHALDGPKIMEVDGIGPWNEWVPTTSMRVSRQTVGRPDEAALEMVVYDTEGDEMLGQMGILRQRMVPRELWPRKVAHFAAKWDEFKELTGRMDFTELIEECLASVDVMPQEPAVFMVDEAQDMSVLEMSLARKWGERCEQFVIVGDPDQNLYEWRGSDPHAFAAREAASERVLEQSYRVPGAVRDRALAWIEQIEDRKHVTYLPRGDAGVVWQSKLTYKDAVGTVDLAQQRLAEGRSVMILGACGYHLHHVCAELRERGEPFWNPYRPNQGAWNPLRGVKRLQAFLRPDKRVFGVESRSWTYNDLRLWTDVMQARGYLVRGAKDQLKMKCMKDRRFEDSQADETVPLGSIFDYVDEAHFHPVMELDVDWWEESLKHAERAKQRFACQVYRQRGGRALIENPRLTVGTIHSVKGGEADVVILFPDLSTAGWWDGWKGAGRDAVVRQFYVGMTRARYELVLGEADSNMAVDW